jgi:UbiD family decarboxylase
MAHDLRTFLAALAAARPHDLVTVTAPVRAEQEAIALVRNLEAQGRHPVVRFDRVGDSGIPVVVNVHASEERLAFALGTTRDELNATYVKRLQHLVPPVMAAGGTVQECVVTGDAVDLARLPLLTPFAQCTAPYVSGGIMVVRDPDSGVRNLSYIRLMVKGRNTMSLHAAPFQHTDTIIRHAAKRGHPCEAAVFIGYHPALGLGALAKVPFDVDEYDCCGALLGEPVPLVKCRTVDLEVPADAEMVLEMEIDSTRLTLEGPYGEFTGYALPADQQPSATVRAITHRRNPIYQDVVAGAREHLLMGKIPKEATQERFLRGMFPMVRRVHMPFSGRGRFHLVVSVGAHRPAELRRLMLAAFVNDHFIKHVFIVDEDVDVTSDAEVFWALSTCFQGDRDLLVVDRMPGSSLDPSGAAGATGAKVAFDCTRKRADFPPRFTMDAAILARMQPEVFLSDGGRA